MSLEAPSLYEMTPGRVLGSRYRVLGPARTAGLATTFAVEDQKESGPAELLFFSAGLFEDEGQARSFAQSCEGWKRVHSEAVVRVREVLLLAGPTLLVVTDRPRGETLRARLARDKRLGEEELLELGLRALRALVEIHAHGLVHGDIKPTTIWVEGRGRELRPCLVDGGVTPGLWSAKHLGERTALIGTPFYAPVEQFGGDSPDVQSDLYNLAAVLFECAAGVLPWPGKHFLEIFQAKLDKRPALVRARAREVEISSELEQAIAGGLMADRAARFATAGEFLARLEALDGRAGAPR